MNRPLSLPNAPAFANAHILGGNDVLDNVEPWAKPTIAQVRDAILAGRIMCAVDDPPNVDDHILSSTTTGFQEAVVHGRLFDLGFIPNAMIQRECGRAAGMLAHDHIGHPFREYYVIFHTWEHGGSCYLVDPDGRNFGVPADYFACEAACILLKGVPHLAVSNGLFIKRLPDLEKDELTPVLNVFSRHTQREKNTVDPLIVGNVRDPVLIALMLLATDGVDVDKVAPSDKLNKARAKSGKPPIPSHWQVHTGPYITALAAAHGGRGAGRGDGHHASPIPHLRRGHLRHLHQRHGGGTTWVRDSLINLKDPNAPLSRSFYARRQAEASNGQ